MTTGIISFTCESLVYIRYYQFSMWICGIYQVLSFHCRHFIGLINDDRYYQFHMWILGIYQVLSVFYVNPWYISGIIISLLSFYWTDKLQHILSVLQVNPWYILGIISLTCESKVCIRYYQFSMWIHGIYQVLSFHCCHFIGLINDDRYYQSFFRIHGISRHFIAFINDNSSLTFEYIISYNFIGLVNYNRYY